MVDNASKQDEASLIQVNYPHVKVIRSERNLGFAGGNNLGIKEAKGKYIFLVNNDTVFKDFTYTPSLQRSISIIDPETTEEIKPTLYYDEETNEVKGKCKLKPYKSYFAFEIRDNN